MVTQYYLGTCTDVVATDILHFLTNHNTSNETVLWVVCDVQPSIAVESIIKVLNLYNLKYTYDINTLFIKLTGSGKTLHIKRYVPRFFSDSIRCCVYSQAFVSGSEKMNDEDLRVLKQRVV